MGTDRTLQPGGGRRTPPSSELALEHPIEMDETGARTGPGRRLRAGVALATVALLILAACGDDSSDDGDDEETDPTTTEPAPTTTEQSAEDDEEAAFALVEDAFYERDQLTYQLSQEPELLDDPDNGIVERLRQLATDPNDVTVESTINFAQDLADEGHRQQAAGEIITDSGIYHLQTVDADTITFDFCLMEDSETVDEAGSVVDSYAGSLVGSGEARRVEGSWRVHEMIGDPNQGIELTPGTLQAGACDLLFDASEADTP